MRTKLYSLMAWMVCLAMASCTNQEIIEQASKPVHSNTLNVLTEKQESRSVLSYEGTFYWTENDYIGVYGTETENARFHFTSQADGVSTFTGNMNASEEKVSWAYFPYSEKVDVTKKQLSFPMPAERTVSNENHSPMIGRVEANNTVRFYHTGGILHLKIVGLPEHAAQLVITSEGENSPCLAGTAVIDDITAAGCKYRIDNGSKEVVYDVRNLEGGEYVYSIYLPLQIGTYEKIKVALKNEVGGIIKERSLSDLIVTRGKMTDTPTLHFSNLLYGYELSEEFYDKSKFDKIILFSNELIVMRQKTNDGLRLIFTNVYNVINEGGDAICVNLDNENKVRKVSIRDYVLIMSGYTENTVDVRVLNDSKYNDYPELSIVNFVNSRSMEFDGSFSEPIVNAANFLGYVSNAIGMTSLTKFLGDTLLDLGIDGLIDTQHNGQIKMISKVSTAVIGALVGVFGLASFGVVGGIVGAVGLGAIAAFSVVAALTEYNEYIVAKSFIGGMNVTTMMPCKIDGKFFEAGYYIENTHLTPSEYSSQHSFGLLLKKTFNGNPGNIAIDAEGVEIVSYFHSDVPISDRLIKTKIAYELGYTYFTRAYISVMDMAATPVCFYGNLEHIVFADVNLGDVIVSDGEFRDGKMLFDIEAYGECSNNSAFWRIILYQNEDVYDFRDFMEAYSQKAHFEVALAMTEMKFKSKSSKETWRVGICPLDDAVTPSAMEPIEQQVINLKYDKEPTINLEVQIMNGYPRKISNSRASDDDDEEKWIVKYEVTAKTKGSGWIEQVKINVDGRPVKTGNPKNEGEFFTYTGSKTYKDKSELPTISCDGILINGAGNIQSVPASISIASRL